MPTIKEITPTGQIPKSTDQDRQQSPGIAETILANLLEQIDKGNGCNQEMLKKTLDEAVREMLARCNGK